ncbi:MAG: queuosine precursor transporter [bacterium]|nr:queuosine precursor transporter [bacterium]
MIAYLFAQFVDIWLFHFWKRVTRGRHLWLRNNGSTVVSQLVDTVCVVFVTFWASLMAGAITLAELLALIGGGYAFKLVMALADTLPFYLAVGKLSRYLQIDPARDA